MRIASALTAVILSTSISTAFASESGGVDGWAALLPSIGKLVGEPLGSPGSSALAETGLSFMPIGGDGGGLFPVTPVFGGGGSLPLIPIWGGSGASPLIPIPGSGGTLPVFPLPVPGKP